MLEDIREDFVQLADCIRLAETLCEGVIYKLGTGSYSLLDLHKGQRVLYTDKLSFEYQEFPHTYELVRKDAILAVLEPTNV